MDLMLVENFFMWFLKSCGTLLSVAGADKGVEEADVDGAGDSCFMLPMELPEVDLWIGF